MSMRNSSNNAPSVSRNPIVKEFVKGNSNRTNYNHRLNTSMYYSKHNMSIKKEINADKDNLLNPTTGYVNTTSGVHPVASYSTSKKKTFKSKNFTNFSYSNAVTSRITTNVSSSTSVPKAEIPSTNFLNYKILSQNTNTKIKFEANSVVSSNSFNFPTNYPNKKDNNSVSQPNRKKIQNFLVMSHLNSSLRTESVCNTNNDSNNYNFFNYMKEGFKSKEHTPDLSRRIIEFEGSICENSKEKQFIDSNYNFATTHDKNEENILRIFQEQNTSGRSINTTILRQIIKENPEIFDNRKSKSSTSDETIKNTNYSTKNIESDSIEYLHFLFVNFFQKSKQILHTQENSFILNDKSNSLLTVTPCEEIELD